MPGACCDMGASTTLDKAQILKSGCTLADAAQACALAATWRALQHGCERRPKQAQILQSPLMLAGAEWPGSTGDPWRVSSMRPCSGKPLLRNGSATVHAPLLRHAPLPGTQCGRGQLVTPGAFQANLLVRPAGVNLWPRCLRHLRWHPGRERQACSASALGAILRMAAPSARGPRQLLHFALRRGSAGGPSSLRLA